MDYIPAYRKILLDVLEDYRAWMANSSKELRYTVAHDPERDHFLLMCYGWEKREFVHTVLFHFDIIDRKIWLQRNTTDRNPVEDLLDAGIPKCDIVLGFQSPESRKHTGYAIG